MSATPDERPARLAADSVPSPVGDVERRRPLDGLAGLLCVGLSLYALYWVLFIVQPQVYRVSFLLVALVATFLLYPFSTRSGRASPGDWVLALLTVVALGWPLFDF